MMIEKGSIKLGVLEGLLRKTRNQTIDEILALLGYRLDELQKIREEQGKDSCEICKVLAVQAEFEAMVEKIKKEKDDG